RALDYRVDYQGMLRSVQFPWRIDECGRARLLAGFQITYRLRSVGRRHGNQCGVALHRLCRNAEWQKADYGGNYARNRSGRWIGHDLPPARNSSLSIVLSLPV